MVIFIFYLLLFATTSLYSRYYFSLLHTTPLYSTRVVALASRELFALSMSMIYLERATKLLFFYQILLHLTPTK